MKVALIDPSNFTLPYDNLLASGLLQNDCEVNLIKRLNRPNEKTTTSGIKEIEHYYGFSEARRESLVKCHLFPLVKLTEHFWNNLTLPTILERLAPDVVHFQWMVIPWLDRRLLKRVFADFKTVITVHDTRLYHGTGKTWLQSMGWKRALKCFDQVIVHTDHSYQVLKHSGVDARSISIIPHGIIPIGSGVDGRRKHKIDECDGKSKLEFLLFGFLKKYKGLETLLLALESMPIGVLGKLKLTIAGTPHPEVGWILERFQSQRLRSSVVLDLRFLPDTALESYIRNSDVVLFPYHRIDASGALMATIPFGKIILASKVGVFNEYLVDGESAILTRPGNAEDLSKAIISLVDDSERRKILEYGAKSIAKSIPSWASIGQMTKKIYELN